MIEPNTEERMAALAPSQNVGQAGATRPGMASIGVIPDQNAAPAIGSDLNEEQRNLLATFPKVSDTTTKTSLLAARAVNPDEAARARDIGSQVGVGTDIALRNMSEVERAAYMQQVDRMQLMERDPALARFLQDRDNALLAQDDLETLHQTKSLFGWQGIPEAFEAGVQQHRTGFQAGMIKARGNMTAAEIEQIEAWEMNSQAMYESAGGGILPATSRVIGQMYDPFKESLAAGSAAGAMAGVYIAATETVPPQIAMPAAFTAGFTASMMRRSYYEMAGYQYYQMKRDGISEGPAQFWSTVAGAINSSLEMIGMVPVAGDITEAGGKLLFKTGIEELKKRGLLGLAGTATRKTVVATGVEGATEGGQALIDHVTSSAAEYFDGRQNITLMTEEGREKMYRDIWANTIEGMYGTFLISAIGPSASFAMDVSRRRRAMAYSQRLEKQIDNAFRSTLRKRNPAAYKALIEARTDATPAANLYVSGAKVDVTLRQMGIQPEQVDGLMPGFSARLREALETGGDVRMTSGEFLAQLATEDVGRALVPHIRVGHPREMSAAQAQEAQAMAASAMRELRDAASKQGQRSSEFVESAGRVEDEVSAMVQATGKFTDEQARYFTDMMLAFVVRGAAETNQTPEQFWAQNRNQILGPNAQMVTQPADLEQRLVDDSGRATQAQRWRWQKAQTGQPTTVTVWHAPAGSEAAQVTQEARERMGRSTTLGDGWYGARDKDVAETYGTPEAFEVTLSNPFVIETSSSRDVLRITNEELQRIRDAGHDGIIMRGTTPHFAGQDRSHQQVVVFNPEQSVKPVTQATPLAQQQFDIAGQRRLDTPEFKAWNERPESEGGANKLSDATGQPMRFYHGTQQGGFTAFDPNFIGTGAGYSRGGFSFVNVRDRAKAYADRGDVDSRITAEQIQAVNKLLQEPGMQERFAAAGFPEQVAFSDGEAMLWDALSDEEVMDGLGEWIDRFERAKDADMVSRLESIRDMTTPQGIQQVYEVYLYAGQNVREVSATPDTIGDVLAGIDVRTQPGGAIIVNMPDGEKVVIVSDPTNIKSTDNRGTFSRATANIYEQAAVPAPDAGVFDANNPPAPLADGQPIVAVLTSDGEVLYDRAATMHGDLAEKFPDKADLIIDGGFIVDGQYQMGQSRGGWSALEGEPDQVALAEELAAKANERRPQMLFQQPVAPQQPTLAKLQMQAKRGIRRQARKVDLSEAEENAVADAAAEFGESVAEIREAVLAHKKAHPTAQGWAGLEFVGIKPKSDSDKGKKGLGLSKLDLKYRQIPYGFSNDVDGDALVVGSPEYQAAMTAMARRMVEEVRNVAQRAAAGDQNAIKIINQSTWYRAMRTALRREFGGLGDLFADLLGATSPNTPVRGNWEFAVDVLRRASRGDFDVQITQWEEWVSEVERLETELRAYINGEMQAMEARGERPTQAAIKRKPEYATRLAALKAARELPDNLVPRQENGQKYGFNGKNIVRAMVGLWRTVREQNVMLGTSAQAPKALNFSGNLIGFRSRATIDVWAARMLQRLAGLLRIPSMAEGGVSGDMLANGTTTLQFGFGQDVFADAAQRIRADQTLSQDPQLAQLNDDDLQALVWFIEKELWTINSWTSVAGEGGSFELEASLTGTSDRARVRSLRKIIDAGVPGKLQAAARSLPAAQQAKIRWYLDPRKAGWRQRIEAIRAELDAVPTTLPKKDQRAMRAEIRERLDAAIRKSGLARIDRNINAAVRADAKVAVIEEKRKAAQTELISMERRVDRFTAGLSQQQSLDSQGVDYVPTDADQARLAERVRTRAYQADSEGRIVAVKAMSTEGRYGSIERSIDLEAVVQEGWSPVELWRAMVEEARNARQESTFLSRVLRDGEAIDPARHRPGLEIYFKSPIPRDKLDALIEKLNANGVDFFTVIVDARRSTEARSGAMADAVGIRMQYVPEYMQRYGIEDFAGLSEADIASRVKAKEAEWALLADQVMRTMPDVSFASVFWHETRVAFADAYESEINAITTGTATGVGGLPAETQWGGQSVSEGVAAADRFVKSRAAPTQPDGAGQVPGGVQEGDRVGLAQPAADTALKQEAVPGEPSEPQGTFDIETFVTKVNAGGNFSTLVHESSHYWLEVMGRIAASVGAPPGIAADFDTILQWFGIEGATPAERLAKWNSMSLAEKEPHHEAWARNMEIWVFEGKAPSAELRPAFERFRRWMGQVYIAIRDQFNAQYRQQFGKDLPIMSPEVQQVFERMFATDEQIARERATRQAMALFQTQEESGMNDAEWAAFQAMVLEDDIEAAAEFRKRSMAQLKWLRRARDGRLREMQKDTDKRREEVRGEVEARLREERVHKARRFLRSGTVMGPEGEEIVVEGHRLNIDGVNRLYELEPEALRPDLSKLGTGAYGMLGKDGMDPNVAAEMLGYRSADEMIRDLIDAPSLEDAVEAETDKVMLAENGELNTPEEREEAIDAALHQEAHTRLIAVQLRLMSKAIQPVRMMVDAARQVARNMLRGKKIRDIRAREYVAAEAQAARDAREAWKEFPDPKTAGQSAYTRSMNDQASAIAAGMAMSDAEAVAEQARVDATARAQAKIDEFKAKYPTEDPSLVAIAAKRLELLNNQLAREAIAARDEVDKALKRFRKMFGADEKVAKTRNMDRVYAARAILGAFGLGRREAEILKYMEQLRQYDPEIHAELQPLVDAAMAGRMDWRDMTLDQFRSVRDAVESLWADAKSQREITVDGQAVALETALTELEARAEEIGVPEQVPGDAQAASLKERTMRSIMHGKAQARMVESWAEAMDAQRVDGPFTRYIWRPIKDAVNRYRVDRNKYVKKFVDLLQGLTLPVGKIASDELGYTFGAGNGGIGKAEVLGAMMHMGNESNLRKLLLGRGWGTLDADGNLDTSRWDAFVARMFAEGVITKADMDFLQAVWDLNEEIKPLAQKAHKKIFGYYFKEIEAKPVVTPFGTYRGGYVPAKTDPFIVREARQQQAAEQLESDYRYAMPSTGDGFRFSRVDYNKALSLDIRMMAAHIDSVIRFAHIQPAVKDVLKVIRNREFADMLTRMDPAAIEDMLIPWLNRAARQVTTEPGRYTPADRFWRSLRQRSGMNIMFANISNTMQQLTGLMIGMVKVKPMYVRGAMVSYAKSPRETANMVAAASPFMDDRMRSQIFQLQEDMNDILLNPSAFGKMQAWAKKHAYFAQQAYQNIVDIIVWTGAYNQAIAEAKLGLPADKAHAEAVQRADSTVRLTQSSLSPEDVSRIAAGTPFFQTFVQFTNYFNMLANLNATEYTVIFRDLGWRNAKGRLFMTYLLGYAMPMIVSDAIAKTFRGQWDDEDDDGYLDEVIDTMFGSQLRGAVALLPFGTAAYVALSAGFTDKTYDDRVMTSPSVSTLEASTVGVAKAIVAAVDPDKDVSDKNIRDVLTAVSWGTGIPVQAMARPILYIRQVINGDIKPTGPIDFVRGMLTGTASEASKR